MSKTTGLDAFGHLNWTVGNEDWIACFDAVTVGDKIRYEVVVDCESGGFVDTIESREIAFADRPSLYSLPDYWADICRDHYRDSRKREHYVGIRSTALTRKAWRAHLDKLCPCSEEYPCEACSKCCGEAPDPVSKDKGLPAADVPYGLRNIAIGDEEETRIADGMVEDIGDPEVKAKVQGLIAEGLYEEAYIAALKPTIAGLSRSDAETLTDQWIADIAQEDGWFFDDEADRPVAKQKNEMKEMVMAMFDNLAHELAAESDLLVSELGLGARARNRLRHIQTVEDLSRCSATDLLKIKGIGRVTLREIVEAVAAHGLVIHGADDWLPSGFRRSGQAIDRHGKE